ncbi:hypothetical protein [Clostridium sp.]|uniref:hypothetical protein n=1 Tax=Clostridium sp. TaxID=1506 RepID=UPI003D6D9377
MGKDERPNNNNQCESCDLCHEITADPVDIEKNGAKLLTVRIEVDNVCPGKKVCVACIIYDHCHRILAFRGFTKVVCKEDGCGACVTIRRKLVFALPDTVDIDCLDVRVAANYIYPCE